MQDNSANRSQMQMPGARFTAPPPRVEIQLPYRSESVTLQQARDIYNELRTAIAAAEAYERLNKIDPESVQQRLSTVFQK